MAVHIKVPSANGDVTFSGLAKDQPYYFDIATVTGEVVSPHVGFEAQAKSSGPFHLPEYLGDAPAGTYELRIFEDAPPFDGEDQSEPEDVRVFEYVPEPGLDEEPPPPTQVVRLDRGAVPSTTDQVLSTLILNGTIARGFLVYKAHVDRVICRTPAGAFAARAYRDLVRETRKFLEQVKGPVVDPGNVLTQYRVAGRLPYLDRIAARFPDALGGDPCSDIPEELLTEPFPIELIWSYWQEEGGLVQALNHILARFQNRRTGWGPDPLARFDLSPLRPLRHMLWSWAEAESDRLTVRRRAAEYQFEYGLPLVGRAVPRSELLVERRSQFLQAFHTLLHEALEFFTLDDDTTVHADAFPVYNALRDTHLVLAEGASNQFGDLPTQARQEMLIMQWLLAQPEMRDFLGGKPMVPYDEPWMDRVDTMKTVYGWSGASVTHFHELAVLGERLLLTIRWGDWNSTDMTADSAKNWARTWRQAVQRYAHAYRATTGVDLSAAPDARPPGYLLSRRSGTTARRA
jgi:hypothetical protein